jgi:hypothetical protein
MHMSLIRNFTKNNNAKSNLIFFKKMPFWSKLFGKMWENSSQVYENLRWICRACGVGIFLKKYC